MDDVIYMLPLTEADERAYLGWWLRLAYGTRTNALFN